MLNSIYNALRLARDGFGTVLGSAGVTLNTVILNTLTASVSPGALLAKLNDPFAGKGLGATTYVAFGTAPDQLTLSGNQIVAGNSAPVTGTTYSISVLAVSGDGLHRVGETFSFAASGPVTAWTPSQLGSALVDWIDTSDTTTLTKNAATGAVSAIASKVGTGRSFAQATGSAQPIWSSSARNGLPGMTFNGNSHNLLLNTAANVPAGQAAFAYAGQLYGDTALSSTFKYFISDADASAATRSLGSGNGLLRLQMTTSLASSSIAGVDRSFVASVLAGSSATATLSVDGQTATTGSLTIAAFTPTRRYVGGQAGNSNAISNYFQGVIQELVFTNRDLTSAETDRLHGYLSWKWGFAGANLPTGHPYKSAAPTT